MCSNHLQKPIFKLKVSDLKNTIQTSGMNGRYSRKAGEVCRESLGVK